MWMMAAALGMTAISTAISAKGAADKGIAEQNALNEQASGALRAAAESEDQASEIGVQVQQEEAMRMAKLDSMLGANAARAVAAGVTSDSASLEAIREQNLEVVGRDLGNIAYNGSSQQARLMRQARYGRDAAGSYSRAGGEARKAADMAMWGTIFKGASSMAMYGSLPGLGGKGGGGGGGGDMFGSGAGISPNA